VTWGPNKLFILSLRPWFWCFFANFLFSECWSIIIFVVSCYGSSFWKASFQNEAPKWKFLTLESFSFFLMSGWYAASSAVYPLKRISLSPVHAYQIKLIEMSLRTAYQVSSIFPSSPLPVSNSVGDMSIFVHSLQ
jgi:hypothetical protein